MVVEGKKEETILRSQVRYDGPAEDSNMARELMAAFRRHQSRTLLVEAKSGEEWSGRRLLESCGRLATGLINRCQVKPGQVAMLLCDHSIREIQLAFGLTLAGAGFFGASPTDGIDELRVLCNLVKPTYIVTDRSGELVAQRLKDEMGKWVKRIIWMDQCKVEVEVDANNNCATVGDPDDEGRLGFEDLSAGPLDLDLVERVGQYEINPAKHTFSCLLTSGSTGRPKEVPMSHQMATRGLYSNLSACLNLLPGGGHVLALNKDSIIAGDLPLDHGAGLFTLITSLVLGSKMIVMCSYNEDTFWEAVSRHQITASVASTTFAYGLLLRLKELIELGQLERRQWDLTSFRYLNCCGAKLAFGELIRHIQRHQPQLQVGQSYGCTEIGFIAGLPPEQYGQHMDSVGYLFPGLEVKVEDRRTGEALERPLEGQRRGELLIRSPAQFQQYLCHPDDDPVELMLACHDSSGFYRTGDQVHFDAEGRLYVHGRYKETLFLGEDWKIVPAELEEWVDQHPLVAQSAVVGLPDPDLPGCHAPKAFVRLVHALPPPPSNPLDAEQEAERRVLAEKLEQRDYDFIQRHICQFVDDKVAKVKRLKGGVQILDDFPRVGLLNKIDRKALRAM